MPKFTTALLAIYCLLVATVSAPVHAQPPVPPNDNTVAKIPNKHEQTNSAVESKAAKKKIDLRKAIDDETKRFSANPPTFDPVKIELEKAKQAQKQGWSKRDTALMLVFAVGVAVLVWFVIKYGKECAETNPPNCSLGSDEFCTCERYEEETAERGIRR